AHEAGVLLRVAAVDEAQDVVEALAVERVLVPERRRVAVLGLELEPVRAGEGHRDALVAGRDEDEGGELIDRVLLAADGRQVEQVDEAVTGLVEEAEAGRADDRGAELDLGPRRRR